MKIAAMIRWYMTLLFCKALSHEECIVLCVLEREACTARYRSKRVLRYVERNVDLLCKTVCKTSEEGTATCEMDPR